VQNKDLSDKNESDVIILTMPTSESIFYPYSEGPPELQGLALKWKPWITPALKHLLTPVNLKDEHWCLLIVDLQQKKVTCWDSLTRFDNGKTVNGRDARGNLYTFLEFLTDAKKNTWKGKIDLDPVPQQTITDCGIFCIEFMRAFINGHRTFKGLEGLVSQNTMAAAREHIAREIKERAIIREGRGERNKHKKSKVGQ
jgi:hypothetical protein